MSSKPIESAGRLWSAIVERAGLELELYDKPFLEELATSLGLPTDDFAQTLDRQGVSVERFLKAFLAVLAPYSGMMRDILAFFARVSARSSNENLRIRFDFREASESLDLQNFRDLERHLETVVTMLEVYEIGEFEAYELRHAFVAKEVTYRIENGRWVDIEPADSQVRRWLDESARNRAAASALPSPPSETSEELGALLSRVWGFLQAALSAGVISAEDVRTSVRGAYLLAPGNSNLSQRLREFFERNPTHYVEIPMLLERLDEIFNLPVWKLREELYSVWVGTRLIEALGEGAHVHQVDRAIYFSVRGSHLATLHLPSLGNFHVWAELQTPLANPLGKGRTTRIKPDYVLSGEPLTHPGASVLVVECKQYLLQKKRNFSDALIDYARGHPNAQVVLVNYGPTTSTVLERVGAVAPEVRERTHVIGKFRPGRPDALESFERRVKDVIPAREDQEEMSLQALSDRQPKDRQLRRSRVPSLGAMNGSVTLVWGDSPRDLDLHAWFEDSEGNSAHVDYGNRSYRIAGDRLELSVDVTDGRGSETLRWTSQNDSSLVFAAHNFSGERPLAGCGARIEARIGDSKLELEVPKEGVGRWWHLVALDLDSGTLQLNNTIAHEAPRRGFND